MSHSISYREPSKGKRASNNISWNFTERGIEIQKKMFLLNCSISQFLEGDLRFPLLSPEPRPWLEIGADFIYLCRKDSLSLNWISLLVLLISSIELQKREMLEWELQTFISRRYLGILCTGLIIKSSRDNFT